MAPPGMPRVITEWRARTNPLSMVQNQIIKEKKKGKKNTNILSLVYDMIQYLYIFWNNDHRCICKIIYLPSLRIFSCIAFNIYFFNNFQICHTVLLLLLFSEALSSSAQKPPGPNDRQTCFVRDQIWGFYIQYIHSSPAHWALFPACCITILLTYSHNAEYYIAGLNYFVIGSLYHLNSVTHFANSTPLSLPITHLFSLPW